MNYISTRHEKLPELGELVMFKHYKHGWLVGKYANHSYYGNCFLAYKNEFNSLWGFFENESILQWAY